MDRQIYLLILSLLLAVTSLPGQASRPLSDLLFADVNVVGLLYDLDAGTVNPRLRVAYHSHAGLDFAFHKFAEPREPATEVYDGVRTDRQTSFGVRMGFAFPGRGRKPDGNHQAY